MQSAFRSAITSARPRVVASSSSRQSSSSGHTSVTTPSGSDLRGSAEIVPSHNAISPQPTTSAVTAVTPTIAEPTRGRLRRFLDVLSSGSTAVSISSNQGLVKPSELRAGKERVSRVRPGVVNSVMVKGSSDESSRLFDPSAAIYTRSYRPHEHKASTANFKIGPRKLDLLSRLIRRLPVDQALLQLEYSDKAHARRIRSMLVQAKSHAVAYKSLDPSKLIVDETWVTKGKVLKRIDIKAKAGRGVKLHKASRLHVILREGPSQEEVRRRKLEREFKIRMRSGAMPLLKETRAIGGHALVHRW